MNLFNNYLYNILLIDERIMQHKCILMGDFNINMLNVNVRQSYADFSNCMEENGFRQIIDKPTRCVNGIPFSLLDHIYINFGDQYRAFVHDYLISDHLPISIEMRGKFENKIVKQSFRILSNENFNKFKAEKTELFNSYSIAPGDVNEEFDRFNSWLDRLLDKYFPYKVKYLSLKRLKMPWINDEILALINVKHKLFIDVKRNYVPYRIFCAYSKLLKLLLERLRIAYFKRKRLFIQEKLG